jgi:hypothetical protein
MSSASKANALAKKLGPSRKDAIASLWGTGASAALAVGGAGVVYASGERSARPLLEGATGGFVLGALAGVSIAAFSPKNRAFGMGMVGLGGLAALGGLAMTFLNGAPVPSTGKNHQVTMTEGGNVIVRAQAGDTITLLAPMGWSVPAISAASPVGTLAVFASDAASSSATFRASVNGSADVTSTSPAGIVASAAIDVS